MVREARRSFRLNSLSLEELNFMLAQLGDRLDELEGRRGTPKFRSNVDMGLNRVTQMQSGSLATDGATVVQVDNVEASLDNLGAATGGVQNLSASATPGSNRLVMSPASSQYIDKEWLPADLGERTLVWDKLITGAVTSVTTGGEVTLDGNAHGGYVLEFYLVENGASDYDLFYNNDQTAGNYYRTIMYANSTAGPLKSYAGDAKLILGQGSGAFHQINGHIGRHPSGMPMTCVQYGTDTNTLVGTVQHRYYSTITNLTRIDIVSSIANGIGINSQFRLWRRI